MSALAVLDMNEFRSIAHRARTREVAQANKLREMCGRQSTVEDIISDIPQILIRTAANGEFVATIYRLSPSEYYHPENPGKIEPGTGRKANCVRISHAHGVTRHYTNGFPNDGRVVVLTGVADQLFQALVEADEQRLTAKDKLNPEIVVIKEQWNEPLVGGGGYELRTLDTARIVLNLYQHPDFVAEVNRWAPTLPGKS